jgi:hypothetical protein
MPTKSQFPSLPFDLELRFAYALKLGGYTGIAEDGNYVYEFWWDGCSADFNHFEVHAKLR